MVMVSKNGDAITLKNTKQRNAQEFADISLRFATTGTGASVYLKLSDTIPSGGRLCAGG